MMHPTNKGSPLYVQKRNMAEIGDLYVRPLNDRRDHSLRRRRDVALDKDAQSTAS